MLNLNVDILETVKNEFSHTEIFLQSADGVYDLEIINRTIDMCRLFSDITYEPILQVGLRLYKSSSKFIRGCVIKKVINYEVHFITLIENIIFELGHLQLEKS